MLTIKSGSTGWALCTRSELPLIIEGCLGKDLSQIVGKGLDGGRRTHQYRLG